MLDEITDYVKFLRLQVKVITPNSSWVSPVFLILISNLVDKLILLFLMDLVLSLYLMTTFKWGFMILMVKSVAYQCIFILSCLPLLFTAPWLIIIWHEHNQKGFVPLGTNSLVHAILLLKASDSMFTLLMQCNHFELITT